MLKHILQIIWNERKRNIGIWFELFLVSVFLWFIVDFMYVSIFQVYIKPLGFDTENTYVMRLGLLNENSNEFVKEDSMDVKIEQLLTIKDRIRNNPMIEAVSLSWHSSPHIGSNRQFGIKRDTVYTSNPVLYRMVTPDFFKVFQYQSKNGSTEELVNVLERNEFVISESIEKELFPRESAVGQHISFGDTTKYKVGAVSKNVRYDNFTTWDQYIARLLSNRWLSIFTDDGITALEICVRVKPEENHNFIKRFRQEMSEQLRVGNYYLSTIHYIPEVKKTYQRDEMKNLQTRMFILLFLLINIFLGITGTFWFRTQHRRSEIGLRIALGDTPKRILHKYYIEGILLLSMTIIPVCFIIYILKITDLLSFHETFTWARYFIGFAITYILLAVMIILGIWFPARKAIKIPPSVALKDE